MKRVTVRKALGVLLAGSLSMTALYAEEDFTGVGLVGVGASINHYKTLDNLNLENDYSAPSFDIKLGAKNNDWRFMGTYSFVKDETVAGSTAKNVLLTGSVDYLIYNAPMGNGVVLQPFIGVVGGYEEYKYGGAIDESGAAYGGQIGAILDMQDCSVDAGFKYFGTTLDSVDEVYGFSVGLNYKIK